MSSVSDIVTPLRLAVSGQSRALQLRPETPQDVQRAGFGRRTPDTTHEPSREVRPLGRTRLRSLRGGFLVPVGERISGCRSASIPNRKTSGTTSYPRTRKRARYGFNSIGRIGYYTSPSSTRLKNQRRTVTPRTSQTHRRNRPHHGLCPQDGSPTDPFVCSGSRAKHLRKEMHTTLKRLQERDASSGVPTNGSTTTRTPSPTSWRKRLGKPSSTPSSLKIRCW